MKKQALCGLALAATLLFSLPSLAQTTGTGTQPGTSTQTPTTGQPNTNVSGGMTDTTQKSTTTESGVQQPGAVSGTGTSVSTQTNAAGSTTGTIDPTGGTFYGRERRGGSTSRDLSLSAARSREHTILFRALRVAGLTDQASGKGPFTVFAPTDAAFQQLPAGTLDELMKPAAKQRLMRLLAGHVVKGRLTSDQLEDGQKLKTVTGQTLTVSKQGEAVTITDAAGNTATVNWPDIEATNGIVHSVDTVLVPATTVSAKGK
ncbi:fasciclin domain-containing protein [Tellurirhabdus rosea]|uniref:fasciclin domain-containing protein n=1 Tax=Tellurirhabdus rosea TaxID=2674997 RepID=UPI002258E059|nr:fasciclin domain-containing protein [Tellurirhabdus rosea]